MPSSVGQRIILFLGMVSFLAVDAGGTEYTVHGVDPAITNHLILPDGRLPPIRQQVKTIEVPACRGEYEPASLVISRSAPLENVQIQIGQVTGPGQPWPKNAIDVRVVKDLFPIGHAP